MLDTLVAVLIVAVAALWAAVSLFRRLFGKRASGCAGGCEGCALARPSGRPGAACSAAAPPPVAVRPGAVPLPSRGGGRA